MAGKKQEETERPTIDLAEVYAERDKLLSLIYRMAQRLGYKVGIKDDPDEPYWPLVFIDLPSGQVSWHIKKEELDWFHPDPSQQVRAYEPEWDGHSTEEKYRRVLAYEHR